MALEQHGQREGEGEKRVGRTGPGRVAASSDRESLLEGDPPEGAVASIADGGGVGVAPDVAPDVAPGKAPGKAPGEAPGEAPDGARDTTSYPAGDGRLDAALDGAIGGAISESAGADLAARVMQELSVIIQSLPDGVYVGTDEGIQLANRRGLELLGARRVEDLPPGAAAVMARLRHRDARSGRPLARAEEPFLRALRGERSVRELLVRHLGRAQDRVLRAAAAPIEVDGRIAGAVAVTSDITELIRAREAKSALAEAGRLLASSLDCDATLVEVMPLLVPRFADYVIVQVRTNAEDGGSGCRQVAAAHADARQRHLLDEMAELVERRSPGVRDESLPAPGERHGLLVSGVDETMLRALVSDPAERAIHRQLAPHSFVVAPLLAHGRAFGTIMVASTRANRPVGEAERQLVSELATRIALALDAARLHDAEQRARAAAEAASQAKCRPSWPR